MAITNFRKFLPEIRKQSVFLSTLGESEKNRILMKIASNLISSQKRILKANRKDLNEARKKGKSSAFIDRLALDENRIRDMAKGVREIARLKSGIGETIGKWRRPNGLTIRKMRVPIGVLLIIYESRPNVTSDAAALALKSGNAAVLRGGSDAVHSNTAIFKAIKKSLPAKIKNAVYFVNIPRDKVSELLKMRDFIDVVIPRGGENLINAVVENSAIPILYHGKGVCNLYIHEKADLKMAVKIALNAKVQRPGVCNAIENLLVDRKIAKKFLPMIYDAFRKENVEMRGDAETKKILKNIKRATNSDWNTEYLEKIISIKSVKNISEAVSFINIYGSRHSEAIVTQDKTAAAIFLSMVDAACVYHNASTRFTDGGQFGMGAEIGISNQKLHARGPVGIKELTTYKYVIQGSGQIRK
ncbi:MAG: glutamate-5-semialdehyde dehydrogenase [Elusimicrobia bacterium]|nr:glutamate-5-semialdehyde dehydrogenase [Elusimicrobiota bacterium]